MCFISIKFYCVLSFYISAEKESVKECGYFSENLYSIFIFKIWYTQIEKNLHINKILILSGLNR